MAASDDAVLRYIPMASTGPLTFKAQYVARRIDLDRVAGKVRAPEVRRTRNRAILEIGDRQYVVAYSFGVLAFLGTTAEQEQRVRKLVRPALHEPEANGCSDAYVVEVDPSLTSDAVEFHRVRIHEFTLDHVDLIGRVLAQSVAITQFNMGVDRMIEQLQPVYAAMRRHGELRTRPRELIRIIGADHEILQSIIAGLALLNTPKATWSDPHLEQLWIDLREQFELPDRFDRLEFKLGYIRDSMDRLLGVIQARRAEFLEVIIVALFIFDIVLVLYEVFWK